MCEPEQMPENFSKTYSNEFSYYWACRDYLSGIIYEFSLCCRLRGSVFPKTFVWSVPSTFAAIVLKYFFTYMEGGGKLSDSFGSGPRDLWSSYTTVLGILIVFRTNQAYSRYWEGATLLQTIRGEWFNAISSTVAFCNSDESYKEDVEHFQHLAVRLMSMLYCSALQQISVVPSDKFDIIDNTGIDVDSLMYLAQNPKRVEVLLQWLQRLIMNNLQNGVLNCTPPILSRVFQELSRGIVNLNNVRKIAELPFPFPYTQLIMSCLFLHTGLMPIVAAITCDSVTWAATITNVTVTALWSLNYIASELEHPFGEDFNDLPVVDMVQDMNSSLAALLNQCTQLCPDFDYDAKLHAACRRTSCDAMDSIPVPQRPGFAKLKTATTLRNLDHLDGHESRHSWHESRHSWHKPKTSDASTSYPLANSSSQDGKDARPGPGFLGDDYDYEYEGKTFAETDCRVQKKSSGKVEVVVTDYLNIPWEEMSNPPHRIGVKTATGDATPPASREGTETQLQWRESSPTTSRCVTTRDTCDDTKWISNGRDLGVQSPQRTTPSASTEKSRKQVCFGSDIDLIDGKRKSNRDPELDSEGFAT